MLLQRTTAKEQQRRLIAAVLPSEALHEYGGVVVENHVNIVRPVASALRGCAGLLTPQILSSILNSRVADRIFRCMSGSVAVSAYEIEALPVPDPDAMRSLGDLVRRSATSQEIDQFLLDAYHDRLEQLAS